MRWTHQPNHSFAKEKTMSKHKAKTNPANPTKPSDATRVQGDVAAKHDGKIPPKSHVRRMQKAAVKNFGKSGGKKTK
jgi:hypothetical protein